MIIKENIAKYSTLFLDRDGTINVRKIGGYVQSVEEFEFLPGALEALYYFNTVFDRVIIVTNQQGIGKELMTTEELHVVHEFMMDKIKCNGAHIDEIYHCPHMAVFNPSCRKPAPGMALQAQQDFPDISFEHAIMVGDSDSDILFGKNLGMYTVRIIDHTNEVNTKANLNVPSLLQFAKLIT